MRIGELAFQIHVHRVHAWRLARSGVIPNTKKTKGGHYFFAKSRALTRWINFMKSSGAFRKKEMTRAYKKHYGIHRLLQHKTERHHWRAYKAILRRRKKYGTQNNSYDDLFLRFYDDTESLIKILNELKDWHECKLKTEMLKTSKERLSVLNGLIDDWLSQQQSSGA